MCNLVEVLVQRVTAHVLHTQISLCGEQSVSASTAQLTAHYAPLLPVCHRQTRRPHSILFEDLQDAMQDVAQTDACLQAGTRIYASTPQKQKRIWHQRTALSHQLPYTQETATVSF